MTNYNTRDIATNIVMDVTQEEAYNNIALKKALQQYNEITIQDKAFITEIVNGTLRNILYIDYIIEQFSSVKLSKIKPLLLNIMRIAVYQIKFMDRVPDSAACNEAVKISKKRGHTALSGFVNGVLRNIIRNKDSIKLPDENKEPIKYLSVVYSYPEWMVAKFLEEHNYSFVKELCIKNNSAPDVTIAVNTLKISTEALKEKLENEKVTVEDGKYLKNALHISRTSDLSNLKAYNEGYFHVQDEASQLAIQVLDPQEEDYIIDVCSAPGGKSLICAEKMNNKGIIKARDIYPHKLTLIEESAKRLGIDIIQTQNWDATLLDNDNIARADRVLIDAPCSGFGLIRKKSDIKLKKKVEDIKNLQQIQRKILTVCSEYVKLKGVLVYSTCTMSKEENSDNINWFVENFPFELEDISALLPENIDNTTAKQGYIQLYPNINDTDGFFIARLRRKR